MGDALDQAHLIFPQNVVKVIQQDLIERHGLKPFLDDPNLLHTLNPDLPLIVNLLQSKPLLNPHQQKVIQDLIYKALNQLIDALKVKYLPQLRGLFWRLFLQSALTPLFHF